MSEQFILGVSCLILRKWESLFSLSMSKLILSYVGPSSLGFISDSTKLLWEGHLHFSQGLFKRRNRFQKKNFFFFLMRGLGSNSISLEGFVYNVLISPQRKTPVRNSRSWFLVLVVSLIPFILGKSGSLIPWLPFLCKWK